MPIQADLNRDKPSIDKRVGEIDRAMPIQEGSAIVR
jgi:hypothetical protein